jgi:hypothetical protein
MAKESDPKSSKESNLNHPSRNLSARAGGFGIAAGYEQPYRKPIRKVTDPASTSATIPVNREVYGPLPPAGYYGTGTASRPFPRGQAGFDDELAWYQAQYGEYTLKQKG